MKLIKKDNGRSQYRIESREEAIQLNLRVATLYETMGPNYKDIYWINDRPNVKKVRT